MNSPNGKMGNAISTEEALLAARHALVLAEKSDAKTAICGGLAMHIYGFTRATKDIDFIADKKIDLEAYKELSFGGLAYKVMINNKEYEIDWIIRNDEQKDLYAAALNDRIILENKLPILSPEWLVIIKHVAGRGKDHMDCVWLLRQDELVNRNKMFSIVKNLMGPHAFWAIKDLESIILEADLMKAKDEKYDK